MAWLYRCRYGAVMRASLEDFLRFYRSIRRIKSSLEEE
jgi:hypothetical protein